MNLSARPHPDRSSPVRRPRAGRRGETSRMVPVVIVVAGVLAIWLLVGKQQAPENKVDAPDNPPAAEQVRDESATQAALKQRGMIVVRDPELKCATAIQCRDKTIDDAILAEIATLSQLGSINFAETNVTDEQLRYLSGLGELASLVLNGTSIGDAGLVHLAGLGKLEALHLLDTKVTDEGLKTLGKMSSLKILDLSKTRVTDRGLESIVRLPELKWLLLAETAVSDEGLKRLEAMPLLGRLTLRGARGVTPEGVGRLKTARPKLAVDF
ncbi:MAG: hypothetical protein NTW96_20130 [Planctomycetia bacterium]|nr:hypothetical protein [Planctomycetia bacterium]